MRAGMACEMASAGNGCHTSHDRFDSKQLRGVYTFVYSLTNRHFQKKNVSVNRLMYLCCLFFWF